MIILTIIDDNYKSFHSCYETLDNYYLIHNNNYKTLEKKYFI